MNTPDYLRIDLPDVEYMRIVPIVPLSSFCKFWDSIRLRAGIVSHIRA